MAEQWELERNNQQKHRQKMVLSHKTRCVFCILSAYKKGKPYEKLPFLHLSECFPLLCVGNTVSF